MPKHTSEEQRLLERAAAVLPGGSLGNVKLGGEDAFIVREGRGSHIWDVSGNEYVDYLLGSGPMIMGHANPKVVAAAQEAMTHGSTFFTQTAAAVELAERIVEAVPCAEQVRFTSSGTEATYQALRLARAYRRKDKVLKFEGGFHGMHDYSLMSLSPSGNTPFPLPEPSSGGIPAAVTETVLVAPFNDLQAATDLIERYHKDLAAVIVEPLQRIISPQPGFLEGLREVTARHGVVLIFDEIVTGFRLSYGGAQAAYGVIPDLCALGKIVGGGFPLAAVAGRKEIMDHYDGALVGKEDFVPLIGTLSGNPVACAAGLATLEQLRTPGTYEAYHAKGAHLRNTLQRLFDEAEIPAVVSGHDVMFDVYFTGKPVVDYRSTLVDKRLNGVFDRALLERGVFKSPGKIYVGVCHTDADVTQTIEAFRAGVAAVADAG
ncbi:MAG: aminotransferase class III-fold pyridoxal phosphate-dependent enzyme [Chloroflexota bacterium]